MALNTSKCNRLTPLPFKGLRQMQRYRQSSSENVYALYALFLLLPNSPTLIERHLTLATTHRHKLAPVIGPMLTEETSSFYQLA